MPQITLPAKATLMKPITNYGKVEGQEPTIRGAYLDSAKVGVYSDYIGKEC